MIRLLPCLLLLLVVIEIDLPAQTVPDDFQQGLTALQQNRLSDALTAFGAAEQAHPNDPRTHNFRGICLMTLGRSGEAAAEYLRAIELDDRMEDALRNLGFLESTAHENEKARQHLRRALQLSPEDGFAAYYLMQLEVAEQRYVEANSVLKPFAVGRLPWAQFDLALAQLHAGQFQESAITAQSLCQRPNMAAACSVLGIAESRLHHDDVSLAAFRQATGRAPDQEEYWLNLTHQQMETKHFDDAIASTLDGLRSVPRSYALHLRLGAAYLSAGRYKDAERSFRDLVSAGDPLPTSAIGLAQVLLRTDRASEAATVLAEAEYRLGPQFLLMYFQGIALSRAGKREDALRAFRGAVKLNPISSEAHLGAGKTALALGQLEESVEELKRVIELDPGNAPARRLLSQAYARTGNQTDAAKYAISSSPSEAEPEASLLGDFILPDWQQPTD